jgi:hypothetical protein
MVSKAHLQHFTLPLVKLWKIERTAHRQTSRGISSQSTADEERPHKSRSSFPGSQWYIKNLLHTHHLGHRPQGRHHRKEANCGSRESTFHHRRYSEIWCLWYSVGRDFPAVKQVSHRRSSLIYFIKRRRADWGRYPPLNVPLERCLFDMCFETFDTSHRHLPGVEETADLFCKRTSTDSRSYLPLGIQLGRSIFGTLNVSTEISPRLTQSCGAGRGRWGLIHHAKDRRTSY